MADELINPFVIKELSTKVELYPHQMNSDLYLNLKTNLKKKLEKKCNKYGFVDKIIKIVDYSDGIIDAENFSANGVYDIRYIASICIPLIKTVIIARVENFNKHLILGVNGPINAIIKISDINPNIFTVRQNGIFIESLKKNFELGDFIKIRIDGKKFSPGDNKIGIIASMIDIASDKEIQDYYSGTGLEIVEEKSINNVQVEFNEDIDFVAEEIKSNVEIKNNYSEI